MGRIPIYRGDAEDAEEAQRVWRVLNGGDNVEASLCCNSLSD